MNKDLTVGKPSQVLWQFCLPMFGSIIFQQLYNIADSLVAGKFIGENALAAVGNSYEITLIFIAFAFGCNIGCSVIVSRYFGAKEYDDMKTSVYTALIGSAVLCAVLMVFGLLGCRSLLELINTPEEILADSALYLDIYVLGLPFMFFYNIATGIFSALGDSKTPFWFLLLSTVLNILLDLFCILVLGWGVAGAAIATVFSQGVSAILCYIYMMRRFDILKTTPAERKFDGALARILMYIGVPMGLQFSITAIGSIMLQSANNALGTACVAAFTAAMRIKMFFMCPFESLGMAMATYSGQNYGAGKPERIWMGVKASALMMIVYWAFTFCVLMFGARTFALLFVDASELEILKNTELFLHISVSFFPVLGLLCILRYTIQGVGYTNLAMLSGVSEMIARILVSLLAVPAFGYLAVCFGDPTAWIFADAFLIPAFIYVYRRILRMKKN